MELKDLVKKVRKGLNLSQKEMAKKMHVDTLTVSRWERGECVPNSDSLEQMGIEYRIKGDDTDSFANLREPNEKDTMQIKLIAPTYKACAGNGNNTEGIEIEYDGTVRVEDAELSAYYSEDSLTAMIVEGDSMEPDINNGDAVVFIEQHETTAQGMPYIVEYLGKLAVKCVEKNKNGYLLRSANKNYESRQITEEDNFRIIGRVVGISPKFKKPKPIY